MNGVQRIRVHERIRSCTNKRSKLFYSKKYNAAQLSKVKLLRHRHCETNIHRDLDTVATSLTVYEWKNR